MGFVGRARDRHFRAMCRCPSPRTTSNGLLRLGYSVHPTSLFRSHPVDLSRLDFLCFPPSLLHHCLCRVVGVDEDRCTAELHPDAGGKADNGREKDGAFSLSPSILRPGRALLCPPPASAPPFHHIPRASAWKASRIAARARSIIARTTAQESLTPTGQVVKSFQKQRRW